MRVGTSATAALVRARAGAGDVVDMGAPTSGDDIVRGRPIDCSTRAIRALIAGYPRWIED
ncbi:hypothetical protein GCM10010196_22540 [Agromyces mediolanus]|uniref:Uncharacterized protein n=1 Tax=Agromyces mediolanus TaxID=41986 RepID=A0A918CK50_AGRME|nr:hypothetical protein GCM10010196_22540 [Agromyces mediolanus]GLJ72050.1 hypothetical protein GCM10017583_13060 [Agromyces mediolanus]